MNSQIVQTHWRAEHKEWNLMPMPFSERFRAELDERGWSQRQAAEHLGIAAQEVNEWVRGKRFPSAPRRPSVARFLHMKSAELSAALDAESNLSERVAALESQMGDLMKKLRKLERELSR